MGTREPLVDRTVWGAAAVVVAVVLLLGAGGTLALWTASDDVDAGSATSGMLDVTAGTCESSWKRVSDNRAVTLILPGDVVTKTCTFSLTAAGDHMTASISTPSSVNLGSGKPDSATATVVTSYTIGGTTIANGGTIDSSANGKTLTATFTVTFPFGDATTVNTSELQGWTAHLNSLTVTLRQTQTSANPET